jgi:hypothetical protein
MGTTTPSLSLPQSLIHSIQPESNSNDDKINIIETLGLGLFKLSLSAPTTAAEGLQIQKSLCSCQAPVQT